MQISLAFRPDPPDNRHYRAALPAGSFLNRFRISFRSIFRRIILHTKYIAILDDETQYAFHLMEYFNRSIRLPYEACVFTAGDKLLSWKERGDIALVVVAESEYAQIREGDFPSVLVLNETDRYLGEEVQSISKYQSTENIVKYLIRHLPDGKKDGSRGIRHGMPMKIIGNYTPVTRCLQTSFSLTMGELLSRKGKTLYLNFESYSGMEQLLGRTFEKNVSDLLYYNECARDKFAMQMNAMTEEVGGLFFIPAMRSVSEMRSVRPEQWIRLLRTIEEVTDYEYLILDLTENADGLFEILRSCDCIYTIERRDPFSEAKIAQYELFLKRMDYQDICARTRRIRFPAFRMLPAQIGSFTRGELADYVRKLLREEAPWL